MKKIVFTFITLTILAASCDKNPVEKLERIAFSVEGIDEDVATRVVSVTTSATLNTNGIYVGCTTGTAGSETQVTGWTSPYSVLFSKTGDYFVGDRWWPQSDGNYHFYGCSQSMTFAAGGTTVAATNTVDVVCAYMPNPSFRNTNTLQFKHIFARLGDVTFVAGDGFTVTDISVTIVPKTGGTYNLRAGNGQTDGTGWSSVTTGSATQIANSTPGTKSNDLYLVPGSYAVTATWKATIGDQTKIYTSDSYSLNVVGGKVTTLTATMTGEASEIQFETSVEAWGAENIGIGEYPLS